VALTKLQFCAQYLFAYFPTAKRTKQKTNVSHAVTGFGLQTMAASGFKIPFSLKAPPLANALLGKFYDF
jgi:hypothetical protein